MKEDSSADSLVQNYVLATADKPFSRAVLFTETERFQVSTIELLGFGIPIHWSIKGKRCFETMVFGLARGGAKGGHAYDSERVETEEEARAAHQLLLEFWTKAFSDPNVDPIGVSR